MVLVLLSYFGYYLSLFVIPFVLYVLFVRDNDGRSYYSNRDIFYEIKLLAAKREVKRYQSKYKKRADSLGDGLEDVLVLATETHTNVQYINGVDQKGNSLTLQITLARGKIAEAYLCLRLHEGSTYVFPGSNHLFQTNQIKPQWKVHGLEIEVVEPFRRYRIIFNGLLQNISEKESEVIEHIRFNFIFNSAASPFQIPHDVDRNLLAEAIATDAWRDGSWRDHLVDQSGFNQIGALKGFVIVGSSATQEELNLVTCRSKFFSVDDRVLLQRALKILMVDSFGNVINILIKSFQEGCSQMNLGCVFTSDNRLLPLKYTDIRISTLARNKLLPSILVTEVRTEGRIFKCVLHLDNSRLVTFTNDIKFHGFQCLNVPAECDINRHQGTALVDFWYNLEGERIFIPERLLHPQRNRSHERLVCDLRSVDCHVLEATGGKGNSLALLMSLNSSDFIVPEGFVITVAAYKLQLASNVFLSTLIQDVNDICVGKKIGDLRTACETVVRRMKYMTLNEEIRDAVLEQLRGYNYNMAAGWAVRSSAVGEDSDELSAAGQNDTFLGLQTESQILEAIHSCWASLYTYQSVNYRWQHGLPIASDMAVVVQQLVSADCAGVMFTCHPSTGSPAEMVITSNFGLGETVVSGQSEPDTFVVNRSWKDELAVKQSQLGIKNVIVRMCSDGLRELQFDDLKESVSLKQENILHLAKVGVHLEKVFGNHRDVEWAFSDGQLYLLQSRPVTTLTTWSDLELSHELDCPMLTEKTVLTVANVREVIPNAPTVLSQTTTVDATDKSLQIYAQNNYDKYSTKAIIYYQHNVFLDVVNSIHKSVGKTVRVSSLILDLAIFGHPVLDERLNDIIISRRGVVSSSNAVKELWRVLKVAWYKKDILDSMRKTAANMDLDIDPNASLWANYSKIDAALDDLLRVAVCHSKLTSVSVLYQVIAMNVLLEGKNELTTEHYTDFALVLSSCEDVISAEIPQYLSKISSIVRDKCKYEEFLTTDSSQGVQWLRENCSEAYEVLQEFLAKHGHRNLGEFEIMEESWGYNPSKLIPMLQANVKRENAASKEKGSIDDIVKKLQTPTSNITRRILRYLMDKIRVAVGVRENSKSELVRAMNDLRTAYRELGGRMVAEGVLPSRDLMYHLTHYELGRVIKETSPSLITKAARRKKLYPHWNKLKFPEIVYGASSIGEREEEPIPITIGSTCKGTPVCTGIAKGRACVISSLDEIDLLETGDILITYSTDIGWSPYFPMITGLVTELGGLVSHGAVVAREYGLPCIVGIKNATKHFKTGDIVLLNANIGEIGKI